MWQRQADPDYSTLLDPNTVDDMRIDTEEQLQKVIDSFPEELKTKLQKLKDDSKRDIHAKMGKKCSGSNVGWMIPYQKKIGAQCIMLSKQNSDIASVFNECRTPPNAESLSFFHEDDDDLLTNPKVPQIWYCYKCVKLRLCIKCLSKFKSGRFMTDTNYRKEAIKEKIREYNQKLLLTTILFEQAYVDVPLAETDCDQAKRFFIENFAVKNRDVIYLLDQDINSCILAYDQIEERLKRNDQKKVLYIHIFAGHGVQKDGKQTLLVNEHEQWSKLSNPQEENLEYDDYNHFYARFDAETTIKNLADKYEHSYHICIFVCCREMEKLEYSYISNAQALKIVKEESQNLTKLKQLKQIGNSFREEKTNKNNQEAFTREVLNQGPVRDQKVSFISSTRCSNFAFVFGSKPGYLVKLNTKMLTELFKSMLGKMDKASRSIELPGALTQIKTDETNFELLMSSTMQKLILYHKKSSQAPKDREKNSQQNNASSQSAISVDEDLPPGSWIFNEELEDFQWHTNWTEQHGRNSFKRAFDFWNDRPQIMDLQEVRKLETFNPYSVVYNLVDQQLILHMVTKDIASLDFIFYESYAPFNKKKKEHSMAISKGNRAMLVNDLRHEESKRDSSIYAMVNVHDFYATGTTFKVVKITFIDASINQLKKFGQENDDTYDPTFDFKSEEFRLELQRNNVWASQLVNCFFLEREIFLLMMVDKTIVCDVNFKILRNIREDVMYSNLRCCTQAYKKHNDQAMFIQGFVYEREKSYRTIKVGGSPVKLTSPFKLDDRFGLVAPPNVYEGKNSNEGVSSLVIRVTFDFKDFKLNHTLEDRKAAIHLKKEKIASILEFGANKMIIATEYSLLLFHDGECVRVYDEWERDIPFVAQNERVKILNKEPGKSSFSEMWLTNKDRNPLGHFSIMPRFDGDQFPFVTCTSLRGIILVNLKENYAETLIDATSTCAWGQPATFFNREGNGMSLHFTISKRLNDRILRLQWVRMPFKQDFLDTLQTLGRLPVKNQTEELLEDLQELNELQYLERRPANRHRREIQREYQRRSDNYEHDNKIHLQELEETDLWEIGVYQKSIEINRLNVKVMQLLSCFLATNRINVMSYNSPILSNTNRKLKFSPFSMELPIPGNQAAVNSLFNTMTMPQTSKLSGLPATGSSSGSSTIIPNSFPNSPTSHVSISLVLKAMHDKKNKDQNSPTTPQLEIRNPFSSKPTVDQLQPFMRMPMATIQHNRATTNDNSLSNQGSAERSDSGSQPRVLGYKNGSPSNALPMRQPNKIAQSLRTKPGKSTNWFRQRSQSSSHTSGDSESPNRVTQTLQPRRQISKVKLNNSLSPTNGSHIQITNVLKTPSQKIPLSPIHGGPVTNIISHTPRVTQTQGGRRPPPGKGVFSDPDFNNSLSPRDLVTTCEPRNRNVMSEKQFVKLGPLELNTSEIFYDKQIAGIENKYSTHEIEKTNKTKIDFHPEEDWNAEDCDVPIVDPDLLWRAVDKSAEVLLRKTEHLKKIEHGIKLKRQDRHDLFKNLSKIQSDQSLFKYIKKLLNKEQEESESQKSSQIEFESLDIEDDSLATIHSENETEESEVNYKLNKQIKSSATISVQQKTKSEIPRNLNDQCPFITSGEKTV